MLNDDHRQWCMPPRWDARVVGSTDDLVRGPPARASVLPPGDVFRVGRGGKGKPGYRRRSTGARVTLVGCVGSDERGDELVATVAVAGVATWHVLRTQRNHLPGP
jgi:hypothetical protein